MKFDVKTVVTFTALLLWMATTVYGMITGEFEPVFEFFKTILTMVVSFYFGMKTGENK